MLYSTAWSLGSIAASALLLPVAASSNEAGFIALPLTKHNGPGPRRLTERQTDHPLARGSANETFLVSVEIGNPKQKVQLAVDIMWYDTIVLGSCDSESLDEARMKQCTNGGNYNINASETANLNRSDHEESHEFKFDDGLEYDDFTFGGYETIKNASFVLERRPYKTYFGSLGLDFGRGVNTRTTTIMDHLVDQNIIDSKSFALTLGSDGDSDGSLVLGGIDTRKFAGPLYKMPIEKPPVDIFGTEYHYWMHLDSVTLDDGAGNVTTTPGFNFIPSSIGEINYLPDDVAGTIANAFGVYNTISERSSYMVDCELRDSVNGSVSLQFPGGLNVSIPYREFLAQRDLDGNLLDDCIILSTPRPGDGKGMWSLGHPFLRAVYAVFDQDEKNIWLAKYQDCGSEVVKFEGGEEVRGQCERDSGSDESGSSDKTNDGSNSSSGGTQDGDGNGSAGARAGVAVGAVVLAVGMTLSRL